MEAIAFESVNKVFRCRRGLFTRATAAPSFALRNVSLRLTAGSVSAVLGQNGSGKTTLLKLISTMLLPDQGRILVYGSDTRNHGQQVRANVGFAIASERSFFPRLTVRENLEFFAALDNVGPRLRPHRIQTILGRTGLLDVAHLLAMNLSSGMYQKLAIARALVKQPSVLLLDEPTRSLDLTAGSGIRTLIRELSAEGTTVVIASHNLEEVAAAADSVIVLRRGQVAASCPISTLTTQAIQSYRLQTTSRAEMPDSAFVLEDCR